MIIYHHGVPEPLPYLISALCYLFDAQGRALLLRRGRPPNRGLYSPVGGKLKQADGESPTDCALREIREETGLALTAGDLHLTGIVSEHGYEDQAHWLMFLYEVIAPVSVEPGQIDEGRLEWHDPASIDRLPIPQTDRQVIWPLFWKFRKKHFMVHINCQGGTMRWSLQQPVSEASTDVIG